VPRQADFLDELDAERIAANPDFPRIHAAALVESPDLV
jgi:hypothetical protein